MTDLTLSRARYSAVRNEVFWATASWIRTLGVLPETSEIKKYAHGAALLRITDGQIYLGLSATAKIAAGVTKSLITHHDPAKARKPVKLPRGDRALRNQEIVRRYRSQNGATTIRHLSAEFGVSAMVVQRALSSAGIAPKRDAAIAEQLSPDAQRLVSICFECLPTDGKRLIEIDPLLREILDRESEDPEFEFAFLADLVSSAGIGLQVVPISESWAVLSRGRILSQVEIDDWLDGVYKRRASQRNPLARRLQTFASPPPVTGLSQTATDLMSVLGVQLWSKRPQPWRAFISATVEIAPSEETDTFRNLKAKDHDAILFAVSKAASYGDIDDGLREIAGRHQDAEVTKVLKSLETLHFELGQIWQDSEIEMINAWIEVTDYRQKIRDGRLLGRDELEIDRFLDFLRASLISGDGDFDMGAIKREFGT